MYYICIYVLLSVCTPPPEHQTSSLRIITLAFPQHHFLPSSENVRAAGHAVVSVAVLGSCLQRIAWTVPRLASFREGAARMGKRIRGKQSGLDDDRVTLSERAQGSHTEPFAEWTLSKRADGLLSKQAAGEFCDGMLSEQTSDYDVMDGASSSSSSSVGARFDDSDDDDAASAPVQPAEIAGPAAELGSDSSNEQCAVDDSGWVPGRNCGTWVPRAHRQLNRQGQVLLANVWTTTRKLPAAAIKSCLSALGGQILKTVPLAQQLTAALLCMSPSRVWRIVQGIRDNGWIPLIPRLPELPRGTPGCTGQLPLAVMKTLVRAALAESTTGGSGEGFAKHISRLAMEGVDVGGKHHTNHFFREAIFLGAKAVQSEDRTDLDEPLGGLGIASSFAVLFDGVPVGGISAFNRHGSVEVICVASVSRRTGRVHARFAAWAVSAAGTKGPDMAAAVLKALAAPPLSLGAGLLRSRLASVGGDGAVVRGGPDRKKPGTRAADLLWLRVHPRPGAAAVPDDDAPLVALADVHPRGAHGPAGDEEWLRDRNALVSITEWDKFHREDVALARAIGSSNLAQERYAVCSLMDHSFGLGDGRLLLMAAADRAGSRIRNGRMPGMTRKAAQLCSEPGHLLTNFRAYAAGMHLREAWRKEGHESKKAGNLVQSGRRLTSVQLVAFTALFRDIMSKAVAPWVQLIQKSAPEPWLVQRRFVEHTGRLQATQDTLGHMRNVIRLCVLLRQWVPTMELRHFVDALLYARPADVFVTTDDNRARQAFGRVLPCIMMNLNGLLNAGSPKFHGVDLQCPTMPWQQDCVVVGPHCQCPFQRPDRRRRVLIKIGPRRRPLEVRVPVWCSSSSGVAAGAPSRRAVQAMPSRHASESSSSTSSASDTSDDDGMATRRCTPPSPVKWTWIQLPQGCPVEGSRFRREIRSVQGGGRCSRCILPQYLPQTFRELDSALKAASLFIEALLLQEEKLFGLEGMSAGMAEATALMSQCFDWGRLTVEKPNAADIVAFRRLNDMLAPYLRLSEWPSRDEFPDVVHGWPDGNTIAVQYSLLLSRLRAAFDRRVFPSWWPLAGYRVEPVVAPASIIAVLRRALGQATQLEATDARQHSSFVHRTSSIVSAFLGHALAASGAPREFRVSPGQLANVGFPWQKHRQRPRLQRSAVSKWGIRQDRAPPDLAVLLLPGVVGKLVHIKEAVAELDWNAVSASIDSSPFFSRDGPKRATGMRRSFTCAWHAVRLHHQCRLLCVPEAACERVGSHMKHAWTKNTSLPVGTLMDITTLISAGVSCSGTRRDEHLVATVAEAMVELGRRPVLSRRAQESRRSAGVTISRAVENYRADAEAALREDGRRASEESDCGADHSERADVASGLSVPLESDDELPAKRSRRSQCTGAATLSELPFEIRAALKRGKPTMSLTASVQRQLDKSVSATRVSALPLWHARKGQRAAADLPPSELKARMGAWLSSTEGAAWLAARDERIAKAFGESSDESSDES